MVSYIVAAKHSLGDVTKANEEKRINDMKQLEIMPNANLQSSKKLQKLPIASEASEKFKRGKRIWFWSRLNIFNFSYFSF